MPTEQGRKEIKMRSKIATLSKGDKLKLLVIVILLLMTAFFGGREIYKSISKSDTIVRSKTELQSSLNNTAWVREEGNIANVILFSQFMDIYDATFDDDKIIYNKPAVYKLLDYSHIEVYDLSGGDYDIRMIGEHKLILKDDKTLLFDGEEYIKDDDFSKWFNALYYD